MSTPNNTNKGKSVPPVDDLTSWADAALVENDSDNEVLAARKFQERQQRRAEKKREEEQKKAEEEWKCVEEVKKAEEARKAAEVRKAEEARKTVEAKKAMASTAGGGAKCEGCESTGADCTMVMPGGSKATVCACRRRQKMGCMCPRVEKKEHWRKWEEPLSPQGSSKRKQTWVRSPEVADDEEEDKDKEEGSLRLIGKWVVAAIDDLQHTLDLEYVAGLEEELDLEVPKEEEAEASVELGELRKEAEEPAEEPEDEESEEEEGSDDEEV
ncbi:hypothetical protein HYDPIDRAFT_34141 [Hydnomerulius pinastri MD-312]|uniref:Uncharacterized protein n=1 Tax=Hydnomerulius pinastri MD-312 TaxID=994086 RepID=A0A0C9VLI2_9AGAM|nr:hypothetical protein HYDPIDRAFT_34141 [Hydnomerulius pinastri MD-312]